MNGNLDREVLALNKSLAVSGCPSTQWILPREALLESMGVVEEAAAAAATLASYWLWKQGGNNMHLILILRSPLQNHNHLIGAKAWL